MRCIFCAPFISFVLALAACTQPRVAVTTPYDLALAGATRIAVHTSGGHIAIKPGTADALHVEAERVAHTESAARALSVTVALESGGQVASVDWSGPAEDQHVSFTVTVPPGLPLDLNSGGGDLTADGLSAGLDAQTRGGDIVVTHYHGTATLHTGGGDIRFDGTLTGENVLQTFGGSIDATVPAQSRLVVSAQSGGGTLSNDFGLPVTPEGIGRRFDGMLGDGTAGSLELSTSGGNVTLHRQ
jgi:hypothetical protein